MLGRSLASMFIMTIKKGLPGIKACFLSLFPVTAKKVILNKAMFFVGAICCTYYVSIMCIVNEFNLFLL